MCEQNYLIGMKIVDVSYCTNDCGADVISSITLFDNKKKYIIRPTDDNDNLLYLYVDEVKESDNEEHHQAEIDAQQQAENDACFGEAEIAAREQAEFEDGRANDNEAEYNNMNGQEGE